MLIYINHDDIRSLELMEELILRGYYVSDQLQDMKYADVIYMGLKGIDNKNRLLVNHETVLLKHDKLRMIKKDALVITIAYNEYLETLSTQYGFRYMALIHDNDFVCKNSILTAEGLVSYLIMHRRFPLFQSKICVLGYGHCAKPIVKYLKIFDCEVHVYVRNQKNKEEIEKKGCTCHSIEELNLKDCDILINTVPHLIVNQQHLDYANPKIFIVDIASYPYGVDHHYALSRGLNSIILPSIPCKYAYGYAGQMIAETIEREIHYA